MTFQRIMALLTPQGAERAGGRLPGSLGPTRQGPEQGGESPLSSDLLRASRGMSDGEREGGRENEGKKEKEGAGEGGGRKEEKEGEGRKFPPRRFASHPTQLGRQDRDESAPRASGFRALSPSFFTRALTRLRGGAQGSPLTDGEAGAKAGEELHLTRPRFHALATAARGSLHAKELGLT